MKRVSYRCVVMQRKRGVAHTAEDNKDNMIKELIVNMWVCYWTAIEIKL